MPLRGFSKFRQLRLPKDGPRLSSIERGPPIFPYDFASSAVSAVKEAANRAASWPSCLAKDVAAFANANGGYIFIGLATKPAVLRVGEEVSELRPIDKTLFDPDRHRKLLEEWLYPQPADIDKVIDADQIAQLR